MPSDAFDELNEKATAWRNNLGRHQGEVLFYEGGDEQPHYPRTNTSAKSPKKRSSFWRRMVRRSKRLLQNFKGRKGL